MSLLVDGLVQYSRCAQNITCLPTEFPEITSFAKKSVCFVTGFNITDPNEETFDIHLDYAEPNDVTTLKFPIFPTPAIEFIPRQFFTAFPNLRIFTMSTHLKELSSDDFVNAFNLTELVLELNKIQVIKANVLSPTAKANGSADTGLPLEKLTELRLYKNEIREIEDNSFSGLNYLKRLDLEQNQLKIIRRLTFAGLPALEDLNLIDNQIETIEDGAFDFPKLDGLMLTTNKLKRLSNDIFQLTPMLRWIGLAQNEIEHIGESLYRLSKVERIFLDKNPIRDIDLNHFASLPKLDSLSLRQIGLTFANTIVIDADAHGWNSPLTFLNIGHSNLSDANELKKLRLFPRIQTLRMEGNNYSNLQVNGYETLKDLLPSLDSLYVDESLNIDCATMTSIARELQAKGVKVDHDCVDKV